MRNQQQASPLDSTAAFSNAKPPGYVVPPLELCSVSPSCSHAWQL